MSVLLTKSISYLVHFTAASEKRIFSVEDNYHYGSKKVPPSYQQNSQTTVLIFVCNEFTFVNTTFRGVSRK